MRRLLTLLTVKKPATNPMAPTASRLGQIVYIRQPGADHSRAGHFQTGTLTADPIALVHSCPSLSVPRPCSSLRTQDILSRSNFPEAGMCLPGTMAHLLIRQQILPPTTCIYWAPLVSALSFSGESISPTRSYNLFSTSLSLTRTAAFSSCTVPATTTESRDKCMSSCIELVTLLRLLTLSS